MFKMVPFKPDDSDIRKISDYFDQIFVSIFDDNSFDVDVKENETSYVVEADLPGIEKENLSIQYENNYLTITARREEKIEEVGNNYMTKERRYGHLKRHFYIDNVDKSGIQASFKNGILKIKLPKLETDISNKTIIDIE